VSFVRGSIAIGPGLKALGCFPFLGRKKVLEEDLGAALELIWPFAGTATATAVEVVSGGDGSENATTAALFLTPGPETTHVVIFLMTGVGRIASDAVCPFINEDE
jgi:hypothetical protein